MKRSYLNVSAPFDAALIALVKECYQYRASIQDIEAKMQLRLEQASGIHGIDAAAVRCLLTWVQERNAGKACRKEIYAAYRAMITGMCMLMSGKPVELRLKFELDKVMQLVSNGKPPKIGQVMKAVACSRAKAHKLLGLAAVRLAAKSSRSSKLREHELPAADRERTLVLAESKSMDARLDASNVVSLPRSD